MKQISGKDFCRVLERHEWTLRSRRGSHHVYRKDGNPNNLSVPVHGNKPLPVGLLRSLMKKAGLTEDDL